MHFRYANYYFLAYFAFTLTCFVRRVIGCLMASVKLAAVDGASNLSTKDQVISGISQLGQQRDRQTGIWTDRRANYNIICDCDTKRGDYGLI